MRVPFDGVTLAAVVDELQAWIGAKAQKWIQTSAESLAIELYHGHIHYLTLNWNTEFHRMHLARRAAGKQEPGGLVQFARAHLDGARLIRVEQDGFDRLARLTFLADAEYTLHVELMGRHSVVVLTNSHQVLASTRWLTASQSRRPIQPGQPYTSPQLERLPPISSAKRGDDYREFEGVSRFLNTTLTENPQLKWLEEISRRNWTPTLLPGRGAYPLDLREIVPSATLHSSISEALDAHFRALELDAALTRGRAALQTSLERVLLAREVALSGLYEGKSRGEQAPEGQVIGDLILAYQASIPLGAESVDVWDFDGQPRTIRLDPDLSPIQNANQHYEKARKAKNALGEILDQIVRIEKACVDLRSALHELAEITTLSQLHDLREEAKRRRWLHIQIPGSHTQKEDRPYAGHRIRELTGPQGYKVLYGENSEANDYLTLRVAKPNDWWLHVRGNVSAHVVIVTANQPDKVPAEVLRYAALVAVRHSPMKHSSYVPVDYTLKKYVRRPRGAKSGTVQYTHERSIHVDAGESG